MHAAPADAGSATGDSRFEEVTIPPCGLGGTLTIPRGALGVVLFAHGSGSSRFSPRNTHVARSLNEAGIGTLLFDLLTEAEGEDRRLVFDIPLLAERLAVATEWVADQESAGQLPLAYFGSSTGAAAALTASCQTGTRIAAIVSRGGRADLVGSDNPRVTAPTLMIVGGNDTAVLALNEAAGRMMTCEHRIEIVRGASHLFVEPGALDRVVELARDWFAEHLRAARASIGTVSDVR